MKIDEIETNSELIREIMEKPPSRIFKWGLLTVLMSLSAIIICAWVISYPTVVPSTITITTTNPPYDILAKTNGKIVDIFVKDNDVVKQDQVVCVIKNTSDYFDVLTLKKLLDSKEADIEINQSYLTKINKEFELGDIQPYFSTYRQAYLTYFSYLNLLKLDKKVFHLNAQININEEKLFNQKKSLSIKKEELGIMRLDYERSEVLYGKEVISKSDLETKKRRFLSLQHDFERIKTDLSITKESIIRLKDLSNKNGLDKLEQKTKYFSNLSESKDQLETSILTWENLYLLKSPINGRISYYDYWSENQNVKVEEEIFGVIPDEEGQIIGKLTMSALNSGKVKRGQKVLIHLDAYPFQEHGSVMGEVEKIALKTKQNEYAVQIKIPNPIITTTKENIDLKSELTGSAEIITEELNLLERVFYQFKKLLSGA